MNAIAEIEDVSFYGGPARLDVNQLVENRGPDRERFDNLPMKGKVVALPFKDPVSFAINAARPLLSRLDLEDRGRIEILVTYTRPGVDFGKSISTYVHNILGPGRNCRLFEVKNACHSGMARPSTAINFVSSQVSPDTKGLVIATDMAKLSVAEGGDALSEDWSFAEPSGGAGAVAILVGESPKIFGVDVGANGYYGFEVMDACHPTPDSKAGNADLSLMNYLDCCESVYREYKFRIVNASYTDTSDFLSFRTPFGDMAKGAHHTMMRRFVHAEDERIKQDFQDRVTPGFSLCGRVRNIVGGSIFLNLLGTIEQRRVTGPSRIRCFSYGSRCYSESYNGITGKGSQDYVRSLKVSQALNKQHELSFVEYEELMRFNSVISFGTRSWELTSELLGDWRNRLKDTGHAVLTQIGEFHREYATL